jgi:hypothetical protein
MSESVNAAWDAVSEALPALEHRAGYLRPRRPPRRWSDGSVSGDARGPHPGRGKAPVTVSGTGEEEAAALRDLDDRLRGVPKPAGGRMDELRRRLRLAYVEGAESWALENRGRGFDRDELGRVIARYLGR